MTLFGCNDRLIVAAIQADADGLYPSTPLGRDRPQIINFCKNNRICWQTVNYNTEYQLNL
jgi:hypothetical protein